MKIKFIRTKIIRNYKNNYQKGASLLLVLVLLFVGITAISSSFAFIGESLRSNGVYIKNTNDLYAAEAGVQDGIYNMLNQSYSGLNALFDTTNYSDYDYSTTWSYDLPDKVNNNNVSVKIKNIWVPYGITAPSSLTQATNVLNNVGGTENGNGTTIENLTVTGGVNSIPNYTVTVTYAGTGSLAPLLISSLGVWLPQGFTYNNRSSNLEGLYSSEQVVQCAGNQAVIWTFPAGTTFGNLHNSLGTTANSIAIQFQYATSLQKLPQALAWINVTPNVDFPYAYTWNADVQVYDIIADAGKTEIESYVPKSATRDLGGAISGDYIAIGNSLMTMAPQTPTSDLHGIRYTLLSDSSATVPVDNNKPDSTVVAAYLYWSGWLQNSSEILGVNPGTDYGTKVKFKINGTQVCFNGNAYAQGTTPISSSANQTQPTNSTNNGDYSYSCYADITTLVQGFLDANGESIFSDALTFNVGPANGFVLGDTGGEWSYAGWSLILIYSNPTTLGHQLYLYDTFRYAAGNGGGSGNGSDIDPTGVTSGPGGVISGFIVPPKITGETIAATFTAFVGEGDWCYAGDFVAFNAPSQYWTNPWSIRDGNPSKLWDGVAVDTSHLALPPYLPNNGAQPDNVWNSYSQGGLSDGVDIKTFNITWASGLLHAGDTSARIDMPTQVDAWNLVYMIFSFRSSVSSGGSISYLIRNRPN
jgi:Tfp pilus assembly protein PilX